MARRATPPATEDETMPFLKQPAPTAEPKPSPAPSNPGHPTADPVIGLVRECTDAAVKRGGSSEEIAAFAIVCFASKLPGTIAAPVTSNPNPGPGNGQTQEPAKS